MKYLIKDVKTDYKLTNEELNEICYVNDKFTIKNKVINRKKVMYICIHNFYNYRVFLIRSYVFC